MDYPTECDEIADALNIANIKTFRDAAAEVTRVVGPPAEIGHQIHDNLAEALLTRAHSATLA